MRVMLATIVLNEIEMLPKLIEQHKNWPGAIGWCIVEGATRAYGEANPKHVTGKGLSTDGTSEFLRDYGNIGSNLPHGITYIPHGWADGSQGQQKQALRNRYCETAELLKPDVLVVIDADEAYTLEDQHRILTLLTCNPNYNCWMLKQRHIWRPPSLAQEPLGRYEIVGGYWDVPHTRLWRWRPGARYSDNHNYLTYTGQTAGVQKLYRFQKGDPECTHLGFARNAGHRAHTNEYYVHRGEGKEKGFNRQKYVDCRALFQDYRPGDLLPHGAKVLFYDPVLPEAWQ